MRAMGILAGLVVIGTAGGLAVAQEAPKAGASSIPLRKPTADEKAILGVIDDFVRAFNAGDAKAIAGLYTVDAHVVDASGEVFEGRSAILEVYTTLFRENSGLTIENRTESIRVIAPDAAIEDGVSRIVRKDKKVSSIARYTATFVKQNGQWLQASVRESPEGPPTPHERLEALSWMLGDWYDEAHDSATHSTVQWSADKNFLVREFTVKVGTRTALTGTQRIGWDPHAGQIKSWVFDSDGGHAEERWARIGNEWVVKAVGALQDGRVSTATHVLTLEGRESCRWRTFDRTVGGDVIAGVDEFVMVRRPPAPKVK